MMMIPGFWNLALRKALDLLAKLATLLIVVGLPFWWFMTQLAEHGWK